MSWCQQVRIRSKPTEQVLSSRSLWGKILKNSSSVHFLVNPTTKTFIWLGGAGVLTCLNAMCTRTFRKEREYNTQITAKACTVVLVAFVQGLRDVLHFEDCRWKDKYASYASHASFHRQKHACLHSINNSSSFSVLMFSSPGGTPIRRQPLSDASDPATIIAQALRKKFANCRPRAQGNLRKDMSSLLW